MAHKRVLRTFICVVLAAAALTGMVDADGLPPGRHTLQPKYWRVLDGYVTNYTPLSFGNRIDNITPGNGGDVWFSVGDSIQRIDANGKMTQFVMPSYLWQVSSIVQIGADTWFSAGQSGKVGKIDARGHLTFQQVVLRRYFPDIRDFVIDRDGQMWFVDPGRRSVGYRSPGGTVEERPLPDGAYPRQMKRCGGKLWISASTPTVSRLGVVDDNLQVRWYENRVPGQQMISDMSCDSRGRLWLSLNPRYQHETVYAARIDRNGAAHTFEFSATWAGPIAPDAAGGVWVSIGSGASYRPGLAHIDGARSRIYELPTQQYGPGSIAVTADTIWLALCDGNSPISIAKLTLPR